jgi:hypothetical protein
MKREDLVEKILDIKGSAAGPGSTSPTRSGA